MHNFFRGTFLLSICFAGIALGIGAMEGLTFLDQPHLWCFEYVFPLNNISNVLCFTSSVYFSG